MSAWNDLIRLKGRKGFLDKDEMRALNECKGEEYSRRVIRKRNKPLREIQAELERFLLIPQYVKILVRIDGFLEKNISRICQFSNHLRPPPREPRD